MSQVGLSEEIRAQLIGVQPGTAVCSALERLIAKDSYLLLVDANERSLTHQLAVHLAKAFPDYDVD